MTFNLLFKAMLHELLTIKNNYITFEKSAAKKENENEFTLSCI